MKKILSTILAIMLLLSLCACSAGQNSPGINSQQAEQDYQTAMRYMKQGKYEEAIAAFNALDDYLDSADRAKYCEAQSYCYIGDYQSAYDILIQIPDLDGVDTLLREIFFETRLFEGLSDFRKVLKNPDSLSVTSVIFTYTTNPNAAWAKENPPCIITTSAQNGFGGYGVSYSLLTEEKGSSIYTYYGSCKSLDYDDMDDFSEAIMAGVINSQLSHTKVENPINIDRVNNIIKLQKYSNISRIDEQNYQDIDY